MADEAYNFFLTTILTVALKSWEKPIFSEEDADGQEKNREVQEIIRKTLSKPRREHPGSYNHWPIFKLLEPDFVSLIHTIVDFDYHKAIIVTRDRNVYSIGAAYNNDNSDDSSDSKTGDICIADYPKKIKELCGKRIKTIARNSYYVLVLTLEGEVYSLHKRGSDKPVVISLTRVFSLSEERIVDIACGSCHSLALTSNGKVYAWGENDHGQVGNESTADFDSSLPRQVKHALEDKNVIRIACGSTFNMVLTDEGKLYGWGNNENGQISIDNTNSPLENCVYPREITILDKIVKVACGDNHTLALTDEGKVYAWGKRYNEKKCVNDIKFSGPTMVNMPEKMWNIAAYRNTSVAVSSNRNIYTWGDRFGTHITVPYPTIFSTIDDAFLHSGFSPVRKNKLTVCTIDYEYVEEVLSILESLGGGFDDSMTSDFTILVEGRLIHVHKEILKIRCQYFKNKFLNDETGNQRAPNLLATYTVSDRYSYIVYKAFLKYLYTGAVDRIISSENALELMTLADEYGETSLKRDYGQIIKPAITASNVAFFYSKAYDCNAEDLEEFCFQFALRHMKDVVLSEDYIKLDPSVKDRFMRRAAKENASRT